MLSDPKREAQIEFEIKTAKEPWRKRLLEAAALLNERGWCAGRFESPRGERCVMGAIHGVSFEPEIIGREPTLRDEHLYQEAITAVRKYIMPKEDWRSLAEWNDKSDAETIIRTLELVARS